MLEAVAIRILHTPPAIPVALVPGAVPKVVTKILDKTPIAAAATTILADCIAIDLHFSGVFLFTLTIETTYNALAGAGIKIHVLTSRDNVNYDTQDWDSWTADLAAGLQIRQSETYDASPAYIKVLIENLSGQIVTDTKVYVTV